MHLCNETSLLANCKYIFPKVATEYFSEWDLWTWTWALLLIGNWTWQRTTISPWKREMFTKHSRSQIYWNIGQVLRIAKDCDQSGDSLPFEDFQPGSFEVPAAGTTEECGVVSVHMVAPACLHICMFACLHICIFACLHVIVWTKENILQQKDEIRKRRRDWRAAIGFVQQQLNHWQLKDRLNVADGPEPWVWDGMIECSPAARVDSLSCQVDELVVLHLDNNIWCSLLSWTRKLEIWVCNTKKCQSVETTLGINL